MREVTWDVFVSYARRDADATAPLVSTLRDAGLRVFTDDSTIADFAGISRTIRTELARSRALLAFYSAAYPHRRACQWELTAAFLAGQREGDPRRRVLVVNPEPDTAHIHPVELRDARHLPAPTTPEGFVGLAERVATHVAGIPTPLGETASLPPPRWVPAPAGAGSPRFTGRIPELWRLHSALHPRAAPLVTGHTAANWAVVCGMAGIGKSLLAQEYALRFGAAYPGGVYWLDLGTGTGTGAAGGAAAGGTAPGGASPVEVAGTAEATERRYRERLGAMVTALTDQGEAQGQGYGREQTPARHAPEPAPASAPAAPKDLPTLLERLARHFTADGRPFLWVVDGVPDGLDAALVHRMRAPHPLGHTVFTSRSRRYSSSATEVGIGAFDTPTARELLLARHPLEIAAGARSTAGTDPSAARLVADTAGHPLALDLLGCDPQRRTFAQLSRLFHDPTRDVLGEIAEDALTPTGYPADVARTLIVDALDTDGPALDTLRAIAACDPVPVTRELVGEIVARADALGVDAATRLAETGIARLSRTCMLAEHESGAWRVPALLRWALHRRDPDTERSELLRKSALAVLGQTHRASIEEGRHPPAVHPPWMPAATRAGSTSEAPMPRQHSVTTQPTDPDRMAAYEIQAELVTRVGIQRLGSEGGILREALNSLHTVLANCREVVRRYNIALTAPGEGRGSDVERLVDELVNDVLRPFLQRWHPALAEHEAARPHDVGSYAHERFWNRAPELRRELDALHGPLLRIARELGEISGSEFGFRRE